MTVRCRCDAANVLARPPRPRRIPTVARQSSPFHEYHARISSEAHANTRRISYAHPAARAIRLGDGDSDPPEHFQRAAGGCPRRTPLARKLLDRCAANSGGSRDRLDSASHPGSRPRNAFFLLASRCFADAALVRRRSFSYSPASVSVGGGILSCPITPAIAHAPDDASCVLLVLSLH